MQSRLAWSVSAPPPPSLAPCGKLAPRCQQQLTLRDVALLRHAPHLRVWAAPTAAWPASGAEHSFRRARAGVIKACLRKDDFICSTYRDHVHALSKGVSARKVGARVVRLAVLAVLAVQRRSGNTTDAQATLLGRARQAAVAHCVCCWPAGGHQAAGRLAAPLAGDVPCELPPLFPAHKMPPRVAFLRSTPGCARRSWPSCSARRRAAAAARAAPCTCLTASTAWWVLVVGVGRGCWSWVLVVGAGGGCWSWVLRRRPARHPAWDRAVGGQLRPAAEAGHGLAVAA